MNNPSKKVLLLDLDNTIFPVSAIGDELFGSVYQLIRDNGEYKGDFDHVRQEIMRRPLLMVARDFSFSDQLTKECLALFEDMTYYKPIATFVDYPVTRKYGCKKYLVTTGFPKLQNSKIEMLGIRNDFEGIFIVDPVHSTRTKKDVFQHIISSNRFRVEDVLVVGDDLNSEIKAGQELGIETVLYDYRHEHTTTDKQKVITDFKELVFISDSLLKLIRTIPKRNNQAFFIILHNGIMRVMNKADYIKKRRFLSSKIIEARESAGFSQLQISKILAISQSTLSKIENGDRRVDFLVLLELAKLYNQDITFFIPENQKGK